MQICGAGPYDQHLMLGEHELTDHSQSLAALGIFPGALLTLKVGRSIIEHNRLKKNREEIIESKYCHRNGEPSDFPLSFMKLLRN